jgi:signal transduction histidine kinase
MAVIGFLQRRAIEAAWFAFGAANLVAVQLWPNWETIPFHFIWISLTLVYGFRIWAPRPTAFVLGIVIAGTGASILSDTFDGSQLWGELFEVPLMSAMFLAMVWHARRRQDASHRLEREVAERAALLRQQKRFLHDVSHELRTPVTIARGHLEVLRRLNGKPPQEIEVALDELGRIEHILERLLLLAKSKQPDFVIPEDVDVQAFMEDLLVRWSGTVPRGWHLGDVPAGTLRVDPEALRIALDALIENAVKYTDGPERIELSARRRGGDLVIEVADEGQGLPPGESERIFERFARADTARSRAEGGAGLGLAIVDAIAKAHRGSCSAESTGTGTVFRLRFPGFAAAVAAGSARRAGLAVPS